jgi:hypothetical protein
VQPPVQWEGSAGSLDRVDADAGTDRPVHHAPAVDERAAVERDLVDAGLGHRLLRREAVLPEVGLGQLEHVDAVAEPVAALAAAADERRDDEHGDPAPAHPSLRRSPHRGRAWTRRLSSP